MDGHDAAPSNPSRVWVPIAIVVVVIAAFAWFLPLRDPGPRTTSAYVFTSISRARWR